MSNKDGASVTESPVRPVNGDSESWNKYWTVLGQSWRREPEISEGRKGFLRTCLAVEDSLVKGVYKFKDVKLTRADVEWLLSNHNGGSGPVQLKESENAMEAYLSGLDLRGADLEQVDLSELPLAGTMFGFAFSYLPALIDDASVRIEDIKLGPAKLNLGNLASADLRGSDFANVTAIGANFSGSLLQSASFYDATMVRCNFSGAKLQGARLSEAVLLGSNFDDAHLESATLDGVHLGGLRSKGKILSFGATFTGAFFDRATSLKSIDMGSHLKDQGQFASFVDLHWGDANISDMGWQSIPMLGDEQYARDRYARDLEAKKTKQERLQAFEDAYRANRQVFAALRNQGMNQEADHFAYRAQLCQQRVFRYRRQFGRYFGSVLLGLLAGHGFKVSRIFIAYGLIVLTFAVLNLTPGAVSSGTLPSWQEALASLQISLNAIHGRVFFAQFALDTLQSWIATVESLVGIVIEGVFVAVLIQRLFSR